MMKLEQPIAGTELTAKACSMADMIAVMEAESDVRKMVLLAHACTHTKDGTKQWPTVDEAMQAPWPLVQACNEAAMAVNGLSVEDASGN